MRKFALEKIDETDFLNRNDFSRTPLPFPDRLNSQRYRAKAFVLFLTSLQPRDFYSGKILDVMALLSKHSFKILHPVSSRPPAAGIRSPTRLRVPPHRPRFRLG